MANIRIIEMIIQQIIRLRQIGHSIRSIAKEMGLNRRTVTNYWELYKASAVPLEEVLDPEKNVHQLLNIQLDKQIDSEKSDHLASFLVEHEKNRNKPGFKVQNLCKHPTNHTPNLPLNFCMHLE